MSIHVPIPVAPHCAAALPQNVEAALRLLSRRKLETLIEAAIALLDAADGDTDLEDDDPAGDYLDERGEAPTDNGAKLLPMLPRYGRNQTRGPLNEKAAHRQWMRDQLPSPTSAALRSVGL